MSFILLLLSFPCQFVDDFRPDVYAQKSKNSGKIKKFFVKTVLARQQAAGASFVQVLPQVSFLPVEKKTSFLARG